MAHVHPSILIIDDHEDLREGLAGFMRFEEYRVETAKDGSAALGKLRAGFHPCIILLDLMMPTMTGFEFRQEQLADAGLKDIPVVICSAMHDLRRVSVHLNVSAYVQKPIPPDRLIAVLRKHCLK